MAILLNSLTFFRPPIMPTDLKRAWWLNDLATSWRKKKKKGYKSCKCSPLHKLHLTCHDHSVLVSSKVKLLIYTLFMTIHDLTRLRVLQTHLRPTQMKSIWKTNLNGTINLIGESCFSSCHERETKQKFWVPMRNRTSDLRIPRCDALPLSHRESTASEVYYKVHMTRVLHTARISNVDNSMGNKFLVICAPVGLHFYRLKESLSPTQCSTKGNQSEKLSNLT